MWWLAISNAREGDAPVGYRKPDPILSNDEPTAAASWPSEIS